MKPVPAYGDPSQGFSRYQVRICGLPVPSPGGPLEGALLKAAKAAGYQAPSATHGLSHLGWSLPWAAQSGFELPALEWATKDSNPLSSAGFIFDKGEWSKEHGA